MKNLLTIGIIALCVYFTYDWEIFQMIWAIAAQLATFATCMVLVVLSKILGG